MPICGFSIRPEKFTVVIHYYFCGRRAVFFENFIIVFTGTETNFALEFPPFILLWLVHDILETC